jgi:hypothetical protein
MGWSWRSISKPFEPKVIGSTFKNPVKWENATRILGVSFGLGYSVADNAAQNATVDAIKKYVGKPKPGEEYDWTDFERNFDGLQNDLAQDAVREANAADATGRNVKGASLIILAAVAIAGGWWWWKKRKRK